MAINEKNKLIGCGSISFFEGKKDGDWLTKQDYAELHMLAVRENYKGKGVGTAIVKQCERLAYEKVNVIRTSTSEKNKIVLELYKRKGYKYVTFFSGDKTDYYSIGMAKWKDGYEPYDTRTIKRKYLITKRKVLMLRKRDRDKFRLWAKILLHKKDI